MLREEAHIWLSRLAMGDITEVELQAFKRWQRSSAAHAAAFEDAKRQWQAMRPALGALLRSDPQIAARHARLMEEPLMGRRAFLGAALGAAAVAGVAVVRPPLGLWPAVGDWNADYHTAIGEQRQVAVADRVNVILNTDTRVRRETVDGRAVGIDLLSGETAIDLVGGGAPFRVQAGAGHIVAEAGHFQVRRQDDQVCVSCLDGALRVEHPSGVRKLQARQQLSYDSSWMSGAADVEPEDISAWRRGELLFRQTPLMQVIDEINRYRPGHVILRAASKRQNPVSGRFRIAVLDEAILQLQRTFDLQARVFPAGVLVLS